MFEQIAKVRSFNRIVTKMIGALHDRYLGCDRPLAESRLIFEIGDVGAEVGEIRSRLDLDSGYVSRLLRSLEKQALIATEPGSLDRRVRKVRLTPAGLNELAELDRRSDRLAESILEPLDGAQRKRLIESMTEIERLLTACAVRIEEVQPSNRDAQKCVAQYFQELAERFQDGFDPTQSLVPTLAEFAPPLGIFLVIRLHGEPVGCGGFKPDEDDTAYIKRMWISRSARGLGLGRRVLQVLETRARDLGYRKVRLETEKSLFEAQQLYRSSGYREVEPFNDERYAHHWFEKSLQ